MYAAKLTIDTGNRLAKLPAIYVDIKMSFRNFWVKTKYLRGITFQIT